jgi:hypothetical protein
VLSAEAALMTREHFVERYGVPVHDRRRRIGRCDPATVDRSQLPGLLDAISASVPLPRRASIAGGVTDCGLLVHYYGPRSVPRHDRAEGGDQRPREHRHVRDVEPVVRRRREPTDGGCDAIGDKVYNARPTPGGRCTLQDINVNVFGVDPDTGSRRPSTT